MSALDQPPDGPRTKVAALGITETLTNQDILKEDLSIYQPTLADIDPDKSGSSWLQSLSSVIDRLSTPNTGWGNARDLQALKYSTQIHPLLPDHNPSLPGFHDVYLASVPHQGFPVSFKHWSFYSQGSFYHLVTVIGNNEQLESKLDIYSVPLDQLDNKMKTVRQDIISLRFQETNNPRQKSNRLPLVAYNVGQTQFTPVQLQTIAKYICGRLTEYSLTEQNCHLFVWSMVQRTTVSQHDGSVFVGTREQIVDWDIHTKRQEGNRPYSQETGYLLFDASRDLSSRPSTYFLNLAGVLSDLRIAQKAVEIGNLYQSGPDSLRAFDPTGRISSTTLYCFSRVREDLRTEGQYLQFGIEHIIQKVKNKEFSKILKAPEEQRLKQYETAMLSVKRGDKGAKWLLPLHRWLLSITDENDQAMRQKLQLDAGSRLANAENCSARQISNYPEGFNAADVYWSTEEALRNQEGLDGFLAPSVQNPEKYYHVGVVYSESRGSATVTLRDCDSNTRAPTGFETIYKSHKDGKLPRKGVRVLGILPSAVARDSLAFVLLEPMVEQDFDRHHELYCVQLTERRLRHIALQSCPEEHQHIKNDSATFISNFLSNLLGHLESQDMICNAESYMVYLRRLNHVNGGLIGTTEVVSRESRILGNTGWLLAEASSSTGGSL